MLLISLLLAGLAALCNAQSTFNPLRPPALPLAVRSPYMSTWQQAGSDGGNGGYLAGQWPTFWVGSITGWTGYVRVDNVTYTWMGDPDVPDETNYFVTQTNYEYTASRSIFTMDVAGTVEMIITFLSPVLPDTLLEMSLPYTYMDVSVHAIDGKTHDVQLYTDISAEWVAGDRSAIAQWTYGTITGNPKPESAVENVPVVDAAAPAASSGSTTTYGTVTSYPKPNGPVTHSSIVISPTSMAAVPHGEHVTGVASPPTNAAKKSSAPFKVNAKTGGVAYHEVWRQTQLEFTESDQQAEWGYWYYATDNTADLTHESGRDITVRAQFINNGFLNNTADTDYRAIDDDYPVFGFAVDMGTVDKTAESALFQLSLHQQNCIYFEAAAGNESVPCLWTNYFDSNEDAVAYFYNEYDDISTSATAFDTQVETDSKAADTSDGLAYYSLTALATRQAFGALEYTNTPDQVWVFLKEISSDGDTQTVDVIFPFHPIVIYANATILKYILEPLFINQEAGYWPYQFAIHDLGTFPNATGYNNIYASVEQQPLEESGNMVIMSLAYAQRTGDNDFLAEHYDILVQWNNYLVNDSLIPGSQLSTDDFLGPIVNDTNLAIKGIIGIEAMAQIANRTGHTEDGLNYSRIAHNYTQQWYNLGFNYNATPPHEEAEYNIANSADLLYNLYADKLLGLDLVKKEIYEIQSRYYPTVFNKYGVPLRNIGSDTVDTKADWEMWVASIAEKSTKNEFVSILSTFLDQTPTSEPFTDFYNTETGGYAEDLFIARPVVGAMFAMLALESAPDSPTVTPISK